MRQSRPASSVATHRRWWPLALLAGMQAVALADLALSNYCINLGNSNYELERYAEAERYFRAAVMLGPWFSSPHCGLALALSAVGRNQDAVPEGERAVLRAPRSPLCRLALGVALAGAGRLDEAASEYRAGLRWAPHDDMLNLCLGDALKRRRAYSEAAAQYRKAWRYGAPGPRTLGSLAEALSGAGDLDASLDVYRALLAVDSNDAYWHDQIGCALYRAGRYKESVREFRAAVAGAPHNSVYRKGLEAALRGQHEAETARGR